MKQQKPCVMIAAGGTGGHIFPALTVADVLRDQGVDVVWLGAPGRLEEKIVPQYGYPVEYIDIGALRGKGWQTLCSAPLRIAQATWQAKKLMQQYNPKLLLAMGGYVTGPAGIAARLHGMPLLIHEQNAFAGMTNKILQRFSTETFAAYDGALTGDHVKTIGNPVRSAFVQLAQQKQAQSLSDSRPLNVLVLGGSQGASAINKAIYEMVAEQVSADTLPIDLLHQCGEREYSHYQQVYAELPQSTLKHRVVPFIDNIEEAYLWADFVIARAGAMTVAELCCVGLPALYIPFPQAVDDHQTYNCRPVVAAGGAFILPQADLTTDKLVATITQLAQNRDTLRSMSSKARGYAKPAAGDDLAAACMRYVQ